MTLNLI